MHLSIFFAVLSGIAFCGGGVMSAVNRDTDYLWYGFLGMIAFMIACSIASHSGL